MSSAALRRLALASLVLMALLWGTTFFSLKALVTQMPVADLLGVRFTMAAVVLGVIGWRHWRMSRRTALQGVAMGLVFGSAQLFQTFGLAHTSASVSGFVTGLYVVFTPILAWLLLRETLPPSTLVAVVLATSGLAVLTLDLRTGFAIGAGELLTLASAVLYAGHIVLADRFSTASTALSLTLVQTVVMALCCLVAALPGGIVMPSGGVQWAWLLYLAVLCGALTIFLQIWAQSLVESTTAAVIMAGEPVWAAFFAVLLGGEHVTWQMLTGGCAMFGAMLLVILAPRFKRRPRPGVA